MRDGLYESLITAALKADIAETAGLEPRIASVDVADEVHVLTSHLANAIARRLDRVKDSAERLKIANELLGLVESDGGSVEPPTRELMALYRATGSRRPAPISTPAEDAAQGRGASDERSW